MKKEYFEKYIGKQIQIYGSNVSIQMELTFIDDKVIIGTNANRTYYFNINNLTGFSVANLEVQDNNE